MCQILALAGLILTKGEATVLRQVVRGAVWRPAQACPAFSPLSVLLRVFSVALCVTVLLGQLDHRSALRAAGVGGFQEGDDL